MNLLRTARWAFLALLLSIIPASSYAGVLISVGITPPVLPVYEQPPCPEPGWLWTPGYWAYGDDGYYWVPGAWVPAPYEGALWTPPYWGWSSGLYIFHPGYWGPHVGFYGGVNYGFGYMGIGFVGGEWRDHEFAYNTAVVRVNTTIIHNTYVNETIVNNHTIINNNHVAYSGGPGGIRHDPSPEERTAMREQHVAATPVQQQHIQAARSDRSFYAKNNGGHPQTLAAARPIAYASHGSQGAPNQGGAARPQFQNSPNNNRGAYNNPSRPQPQPQNRQQPQAQSRQPQYQQQRPQPQYQQQRPQPQYQQQRPQPQYQQQRPQPQYQPQQRPQPQYQPRNEPRPAPQPREESRPQHDEKPHR